MFFVIMLRVSAIIPVFDNPEDTGSANNLSGEILYRQHRSNELQELLSAGHANYNGRDIFHIDERIEKFRARQIRKMDDAVGNLGDFASELFARSQVQLHTFADAALNDAKHGGVRLQGSFFLGEQT